jgi:Gpi18-like mannosyltransferase
VSALLILSKRYRLGWIAAGIAMLTKPQAIAMIPPLGLWTLMNVGIAETGICAAVAVATFVIGILPYDAGHSIRRMVEVYQSLGGRFTDASVGAFNLHAMLGGLETPDTMRIGFVSFYALGIATLLGALAVVMFLVWQARSASAVLLATFISMFALFLLAPRMHERYVYYPLVFLVPLALESRFLAVSFVILSATSFFNLYFVKYLSDTSTFFSDHAHWPVVAASAINVLLFVAVMAYALFRVPLRDGLSASS